MNKFTLQLLKKVTGIDVDELQADFNRVQVENVNISTQLKYTLQDIMAMEKRVNKLETALLRMKSLSVNTVEEEEKTEVVEDTQLPFETVETVTEEEDSTEEVNNKTLIKQLRRRVTLLHQQITQMERDNKLQIEELTARYEQKLQASTEEIKRLKEQIVPEEEPQPISKEQIAVTEEVKETVQVPVEEIPEETPLEAAKEADTSGIVISFDVEPVAEEPKKRPDKEKKQQPEEEPIKETDDAVIVEDEIEEQAEAEALPSVDTVKKDNEIHPELYMPEDLQQALTALGERFAYFRITTRQDGQYLFASNSFKVVQELFEWGFVGTDFVTETEQFFSNGDIVHIQGLNNAFIGEKLVCDFEPETGNIDDISQTLLLSICAYHPLRISYRSKNGSIVHTHLYHVCLKPSKDKYTLPYAGMFDEMCNEEPNFAQLAACSTQHKEPRVYGVAQLLSIEVLDVFYTNKQGLDIRRTAIEKVGKAGLNDMVDLLMASTPKWYKNK